MFRGSGSRFQSGDTLMARITPCLENDKIARYQGLEDEFKAHGSTEFIVIRGRPNVTDSDFAYYLTQSEEVRNYAISQMTGTSGRQRVPTDSLDHLNVTFPPLSEQRAIAHILGTLRRQDRAEPPDERDTGGDGAGRCSSRGSSTSTPCALRWRGRDTGLPPDLAALFPDRLVDSELGEIPGGVGGPGVEGRGGTEPVRASEEGDISTIPGYGGSPDLRPQSRRSRIARIHIGNTLPQR